MHAPRPALLYEEAAPDSEARVPLVHVLASVFGLWLCYFVITTLRGAIIGLDLQGELLAARVLVCAAGMVVTLVLWIVLRAFDTRSLFIKIVAALVMAVPAAVLIAQTNQMAFAELEARLIAKMGAEQGVRIYRDQTGNLLAEIPYLPERGTSQNSDLSARTITLAPADGRLDNWRQLTDVALGRYFLLLAWAALYYALLAGAQARMAERREGRFRRAAKAAELRSLRYQVNPHFLFNTLNSLSALVMTGRSDRAEAMIQAVSRFYRHSLTDEPTMDVALAEEFDLQRQYLEIEAVRFPDRLRAVFDLPSELAAAPVPGMILQPLVENSVRYAVAPDRRPVTITVSARREAEVLRIAVRDDGEGGGGKGREGFGIGLANVRDRLQARFGDAASLQSRSLEGGGYLTELFLPLTLDGGAMHGRKG
ncbi:sensor histidine kinase [Pseudopontixanthobacter vadosimaris]|uniref:sensor histidine kinase n=1 Tax=Pseudopontixanthobacter vadosimaris TaxID=2726450 RepID=UPI00147337F0|nr:histidine kinase [Pseudopontixanthobacter vadosimaris]